MSARSFLDLLEETESRRGKKSLSLLSLLLALYKLDDRTFTEIKEKRKSSKHQGTAVAPGTARDSGGGASRAASQWTGPGAGPRPGGRGLCPRSSH